MVYKHTNIKLQSDNDEQCNVQCYETIVHTRYIEVAKCISQDICGIEDNMWQDHSNFRVTNHKSTTSFSRERQRLI